MGLSQGLDQRRQTIRKLAIPVARQKSRLRRYLYRGAATYLHRKKAASQTTTIQSGSRFRKTGQRWPDSRAKQCRTVAIKKGNRRPACVIESDADPFVAAIKFAYQTENRAKHPRHKQQAEPNWRSSN